MAATATRRASRPRPQTKPRRKKARRPGRTVNGRENDLNRASWLDFLEDLVARDPERRKKMSIDGKPLEDTQCRAYYRWREEGACPSIWSADRFLTAYGHHIDEFFLHCTTHGLAAWARHKPPAWWGADWTFEDLRSSDPIWRREARHELKATPAQSRKIAA